MPWLCRSLHGQSTRQSAATVNIELPEGQQTIDRDDGRKVKDNSSGLERNCPRHMPSLWQPA